MLEIAPIVKSIWRSKTGPVLVVVQLALTVAIVSNALFFIHQRMEKIARPTGIAEHELVRMWVRRVTNDADMEYIIKRDMDVIRALPGVIDAAPISSPPLSDAGNSSGFRREAGDRGAGIEANTFFMVEHGLNTLGMNLIEGRNFRADEIVYIERNFYRPDRINAIVTQKFADEMFHGEPALGKTVFVGGDIPVKIIGIVDRMLGAWSQWEHAGNVVFFPGVRKDDSIDYLARVNEDERDKILLAIVEKLRAIDDTRIVVDEKTMARMKHDSYAGDYAMIKILIVVVFMLVFVNALGIVGLTTFRVNQRRKQIGIRRALGATKAAISRYFIVENALLCLCAAAGGGVIAYLASDYMVRHYALDLLPWPFIPVTGALLLGVTILAALLPAWRASRVSPAEATASV